MSDLVTGILSFLVIIAFTFYMLWRDEKSKKEYLEQLLSRLNKRFNLLEKATPAHYVPTRHHNTATLMQEKASSYQDCVDYEQLQIAVRNGNYSSK